MKRRRFRTVCLALATGLVAFAFTGGALLNGSLENGLDTMGRRLGADILLVPYGYEKKMEGALLRGEPSSFYFKEGLVEKLKKIPGVREVSPQLFLTSLNAGCCSAKVQLIGYDPGTDFVVRPWMAERAVREGGLSDGEVVVGSKIVPNVGEEVMFFSRTFRVAAKLDPTGMGFDTSVFMTIPAARALMRSAELVSGDADAAGEFVSSVVVNVDKGQEPRDVTNAIFRAYATDWNLDAIVTKTMISDIASRLRGFSLLVVGMSGTLGVLAAGLLPVVFSAVLNERRREFALLRLLGASRRWLTRLVMTEAFLVGLVGAILGTAFSCCLLFGFGTPIFQAVGLPHLEPSGKATFLCLLGGFGIAVAAGPLACAYSALRIGKSDICPVLRAD